MDVLWMYYGCIMDVLWMYYGCIMDVLWMYYYEKIMVIFSGTSMFCLPKKLPFVFQPTDRQKSGFEKQHLSHKYEAVIFKDGW